MIPSADVTAWRERAPWSTDAQVEQDLVLSRALVDIFSHDALANALALRGGTALHKLFLAPAVRYSEDIDLVQVKAGEFGELFDLLRKQLGWLGKAKSDRTLRAAKLVYRFESEIPPVTPLRLKIETNTREHFSVLNLQHKPFSVTTPWYTGAANVVTYSLEELLGTKLRALYQRKKGRDLFDLSLALDRWPDLDPAKIVQCFERYIAHGGTPISRDAFSENLQRKLDDPLFLRDIEPLLAPARGAFANDAFADAGYFADNAEEAPSFDAKRAIDQIQTLLVDRLK